MQRCHLCLPSCSLCMQDRTNNEDSDDICLSRLLSEETQNLVKIMPESWLDFCSDLINMILYFWCCVFLDLHDCLGFSKCVFGVVWTREKYVVVYAHI